MTEVEEIANKLLQQFGFIVIGAEPGAQPLRKGQLTNEAGHGNQNLGHPLHVLGPSTEQEYKEQAAFLGKSVWVPKGAHFYRAVAE